MPNLFNAHVIIRQLGENRLKQAPFNPLECFDIGRVQQFPVASPEFETPASSGDKR